MTYYIRSGSSFNVSSKAGLDIHETLPVGTYTVKYNDMAGAYFLDMIEDFAPLGKVYGDSTDKCERIFSTFQSRPNGTGVLLTGEKGSGKTLLARALSIRGREEGYPTIVINDSWHGEKFNLFIQTITQPAVIIFDEFEKIYDRDDQESLLTLLDGVYPSKKMYVLTCNNQYRIDDNMTNRPGRIFYRIDYTGLGIEFIREYCEDNLNDTSHTEAICNLALLFDQFNFDILKALVEEMNRYNESPQDAIALLNASPMRRGELEYEVSCILDGKEVDVHRGYETWSGNPLSQTVSFYYKTPDADEGLESTEFYPSEIVKVDSATGAIYYEDSDGDRLVLKKVDKQGYDWKQAF